MTINACSIKRALRHWLVAAILFCFGGLTLNAPVMAHDVTVNMTGKVTNNTCTVSIGSLNQQIDIGSYPVSIFSRMGNSSTDQKFTIDLEGCGSINRGVQVSFSGTPDTYLSNDYKIDPGAATGIAIEIMDDNKKVIPANSTSKNYLIETGETTKSLVFYAKMVANGEKVAAGNVSAEVTFKTIYP